MVSSIYVGTGPQAGSTKGLDDLKAKIARLSPQMRQELREPLVQAQERLVDDMKAIAPVSELTKTPGDLRDSIHGEDGRTELSVVVAVDAKDEKGEFIGKHVEAGHKARDGSHVPAAPFFYPTLRRDKPAIVAAVSRTMSRVVKDTVN